MKNLLALLLSSTLFIGVTTALPLKGNGVVAQNFYSKSTGNLNLFSTWGSNIDGSGAPPTDLSSPNQYFNVVNQATATIGGNWDVSGAGSKVILGDGVTPISLTIPSAFFIAATTNIDVTNNATLIIQNKTVPFLNNLMTGSTVNFAQTGITSFDTIKIPAVSFYNLKLTSGLKYFSAGTTTIQGNLVADAVTSMNGAKSSISTINTFGNTTLINGSQFESSGTGDNGRLILAMNGSSGTQTLSGNGSNFLLFSLQRDSTSTNENIVAVSGTSLFLGNNTGGGLSLNQGASTTTTLTLGSNDLNIIGGSVINPGSMGKISTLSGTINILKTTGSTNTGTVRFVSGTTLSQLLINLDPSITKDSFMIADNVSVSSLLNLGKGRIILVPGVTLTLKANAVVSGGSVSSFVDGILAKKGTDDFTFPVGKGIKYAPVDIFNIPSNNTYSVQYFNNGYPNNTVNPATLITYPGYKVGTIEYWTVAQSVAGAVDLNFNYTDANSKVILPSQLRIAHFGTVDWNDLGGIPGGANSTTSGNIRVNGVTTFNPFTFSGITSGILPVKLSSFTVQKINSSVQIAWTTAVEVNSKYYEVERSNNERNWISIGTVKSAGISTNGNEYSLTDFNPIKGINYYRLKMVYTDGKFDNSLIKSVSFSKNTRVVIFPNPVNNYANITLLKNDTNPIIIDLVNISGKIVNHTSTTESVIKLNLSGLAKGTYFLKILNGNEISTQKLLKQ